MIDPKAFFEQLQKNEIDFFSGVPDSLLKDFCAYITDNTTKEQNIIAANEGNAIALAAGYHLATQKYPMVYMQNSGIGNAVNPLLSLSDSAVYNIPTLLLVGWRGEPGKKDEPQHVRQGEVTLDLFDAMKIPYLVLSDNAEEAEKQVDQAIATLKSSSAPFALIVKKGTFAKYKLQTKIESNYKLTREEVITEVVKNLNGDEIIVSTTGKTSRELFECREALGQGHDSDFLTVGSMGHSSQIALGIALNKKDRKVICLDGDGALLMHAGSLAIIGNLAPENYIHIVINNGAHESVGGQPTVAFDLDIPQIAIANGYKTAICIQEKEDLEEILSDLHNYEAPFLLEVRVKVGSRDDLGRPTIKPVDNKKNLMQNLAK